MRVVLAAAALQIFFLGATASANKLEDGPGRGPSVSFGHHRFESDWVGTDVDNPIRSWKTSFKGSDSPGDLDHHGRFHGSMGGDYDMGYGMGKDRGSHEKQICAVPEPTTLPLLASGIAGLVLFGRTKRGGRSGAPI